MRKWVTLLFILLLPVPVGAQEIYAAGEVVPAYGAQLGDDNTWTGTQTFTGLIGGDVYIRDVTDLAAESLNETDFATHVKWDVTADFSDAGGNCTFTHNTGAGTCYQTSANGAVPWAALGVSGYYVLTYTVSGVVGATPPVCTVTNAFAATALNLASVNGTYTTAAFQAKTSSPVGNFVISCTSGHAGDVVTFDNLSLKRVIGGDVRVNGQVVTAPGTAALPNYALINEAGTGIYLNAGVIGFTLSSSARFAITTSGLYPTTTDAYPFGGTANLATFAYLSRGTQGSKNKALTDAAVATAVIRVPVATAGFQAGRVIWNAQSTDGTDHRTTAGVIQFAAVNKAGTCTCSVNVVGTDLTASSNANTLVCAWTNVPNTTNCDLSATCTDNTAGSQTMSVNVRVDMPTIATLVYP